MEVKLIAHKVFKAGDRVLIIKNSRYYRGAKDEANPKDVVGTIAKLGEWISVLWDNGIQNGYEAFDLELENEEEATMVDANKIYFKKGFPQSLPHLFEMLYIEDKRVSTPTYYKDKNGNFIEQCRTGKMRSFDDIWIIADTYFPDIDVREVFKELLLWNVTLEEVEKGVVRKQLANCSTMKRIRYTNGVMSLSQLWSFVDCAKFDSVYKWRDLFNMIYINNLEQLTNWYKKELIERKQLKPN